MKALFMLIKSYSLIQQLDILNYGFLYPSYADNTTFLCNIDWVKKLMKTFQEFASFSCLSGDMSKCDIADIKSLKWVKIAVCGTKNVDLTKESIETTRISFSYDVAIPKKLSFLKYKQLEIVGNTRNVTWKKNDI